MKSKFCNIIVIVVLLCTIKVFAETSPILDISITNSNGDTNTVDDVNGNVNVELEISPDVSQYLKFALMIIPAETTVDELRANPSVEQIVCFDEVSNNADRIISYNANMGSFSNGNYTVVIGYTDPSKQLNYAVENFRYANPINISQGEYNAVSAVNTAIKGSDKNQLSAVLKNSNLLAELNGVDADSILLLTDEQFQRMVERLIIYDAFETNEQITSDDVYEFATALSMEIAISCIDNATDVMQIENAILKYNNMYYHFSLTDNIYASKTNDVWTRMLNKSISSIENASDCFLYALYATTLDYSGYHDVKRLLEGWEKISNNVDWSGVKDSDSFGKKLKNNISMFYSMQDIINFINSYSEEQSNRSVGSGGGGGGGNTKVNVSGVFLENPSNDLTVATPKIFNDVPSEHWAYSNIEYLYGLEVIQGYSDGTFKGNESVTRAEFVKMIVKAFGFEHSQEWENSFADLREDDWCYEYISAAAQKGILFGDENGFCNFDSIISRQEMAVMISRAVNSAEITVADKGQAKPFFDAEAIEEWAYMSIMELCAGGIIDGFDDNTFRPTEPLDRYQASAVIFRAIVGVTE